MTAELQNLYDEYEKKWGRDPDFYEEVEYGDTDESYSEYVSDIKKALETNVELPDVCFDEDHPH